MGFINFYLPASGLDLLEMRVIPPDESSTAVGKESGISDDIPENMGREGS